MECQDLIAAAQDAMGGLERLRRIRSYHAVIKRVRNDGAPSTVLVWRAAGGRIRIEERSPAATLVLIANGSAGSIDSAERARLLRDARITPRNMLAHADEHALALRSRPAPDGSRLISFPGELVLYLFDPATHLCRRLFDLPRRRRIDLSDYRLVSGVSTAFTERHHLGDDTGFEDTYQSVAYDLDLSDRLFAPEG